MDGIPDCSSGEDESSRLPCNVDTEFKCPDNGRCIPRRFVYDGYFDCVDHSDETDQLESCNSREFKCVDGRCIPRSWVRNGVKDCSSGEDETSFEENKLLMSECDSDEFGCSNGERCLPVKYKCDGKKHCSDGSDEIDFCEIPQMYPCSHGSSMLVPWSVIRDFLVLRDDFYTSVLQLGYCMGTFKLNTTLLGPIKCKNLN